MKEWPYRVNPGDWILIKQTSDVDRDIPWVGRVTRTSLTKVYFDWAIPNKTNFWKTGLVNPKSDHTVMGDILALFQFNIAAPMSADLLDKLKQLSGIA